MVIIRHNDMKDLRAVNSRRAFTMAESVISLVVIAGMMVVALNMVGSAARSRQVQTAQGRGLALASHLMTEILNTRYKDQDDSTSTSGPEPDETDGTRANFDDVDDYNGWIASPPRTKSGTPIADYNGWVRKVSVNYANPTQPDLNSYSDAGLKRITVTVTSDKDVTTTLVALRAENGVYDHAIIGDATTFIGSVGVTLQIGQAGPTVVSGINLLNEVAGAATIEDELANNPPVAVAAGMPLMGMAPLTVTFAAVGSSDPDPDDTLTYLWDFGDGNSDTGETTIHTYVQKDIYNVTLIVSDNHGATDTATLIVKVGSM